jgi:hypothetical protein
MTNLQLMLSMGVPTIAVLISYLLNNSHLTAVEANLNTRIDNMGARIDRIETRLITIEGDLRQFYRDLGAHEADISNLKNRFRTE